MDTHCPQPLYLEAGKRERVKIRWSADVNNGYFASCTSCFHLLTFEPQPGQRKKEPYLFYLADAPFMLARIPGLFTLVYTFPDIYITRLHIDEQYYRNEGKGQQQWWIESE